MAKNCIMCNKKIGLFEKLYEDKYCKECYNKQVAKMQEMIKMESERVQAKQEEERIRKEKEAMENELRRIKERHEKLNYWKNYLLYDKYFYIILVGISTLPFHYSTTFNSKISNKFDIVRLLLKSMFERLPKEYNLKDIKKLLTYRKSALIISETLQPYINEKLLLQKFYYSQIETEKYSNNPNNNILDETEYNTFLLSISTCYNFQNIINVRINNCIELIKKFEDNKSDLQKKANQPKYDYDKCMNFIEEYDNEENFYIMYIYYDLAIVIIYYIYLMRIIDKMINESELYQIYLKLKNEVHNNYYIIEKLFPIYNSLYKKEFDITIDTKEEFLYVIELFERKNNIREIKEFVNIDESILNQDFDNFVKETDDEDLMNIIIEKISENLTMYKDNVTFEDVFNIYFYKDTFMEIFNKVKEKQAIYEKERILNGNFEEEKKISNDLLDYSSIDNGYEFETFVANLYKMLGYNVIDVTSKSGDQGADVIIEKDYIKYAIQVKYYNNPVGNKAIQEVVAAKSFYKTDKAMVVTNSTFTPQAITLANANDVLLVDGNKLDELIQQVKNTNIN